MRCDVMSRVGFMLLLPFYWEYIGGEKSLLEKRWCHVVRCYVRVLCSCHLFIGNLSFYWGFSVGTAFLLGLFFFILLAFRGYFTNTTALSSHSFYLSFSSQEFFVTNTKRANRVAMTLLVGFQSTSAPSSAMRFPKSPSRRWHIRNSRQEEIWMIALAGFENGLWWRFFFPLTFSDGGGYILSISRKRSQNTA